MNNVIQIPEGIYQERIEYLRTGVNLSRNLPAVDVGELLQRMQMSGDGIVRRMSETLEAVVSGSRLPEPQPVGNYCNASSMRAVREAFKLFAGLHYGGSEVQEYSVNNFLTHLMTLSHRTA